MKEIGIATGAERANDNEAAEGWYDTSAEKVF